MDTGHKIAASFTTGCLLLMLSVFAGVWLTSCCEGDTCGEREGPPELWERIESSTRGPGPYAYVTKTPIRLPNGKAVYCIKADGLWCQEVDAPQAAEARESRPTAKQDFSLPGPAPFGLGNLDFGGSE